MIIQVDEDGAKAINSLMDIALKVGGLQNFSGVTTILSSIKLLKEETPKTEELEKE